MSDLLGETIRGYEFLEQIGRGAFGAVYRAHQFSVGRDVAIKVIHLEHASKTDFQKRFDAEARIIAKLEHPFIIPLHEFWRQENGLVFLVMRFLSGGTLAQYIRDNGALPVKMTIQIVDQIASALATAHRNGVVHRDLTPANILLDHDNNAYLTDFGIAKDFSRIQITTESGALIGTPAYLAPEQIDMKPVAPQTDIYALGIILYQMLTGEHPFAGSPLSELLIKHLQHPIPTLHDTYHYFPPTLDHVLRQATAKQVTDRYSDVIDLAVNFRECLETSYIVSNIANDISKMFDTPRDWKRPHTERQQLTIMMIILLAEPNLWNEPADVIQEKYRKVWDVVVSEFTGQDAAIKRALDEQSVILWGIQTAREDVAEQAINTALSITESFGQTWSTLTSLINIRIAIHTGLATVVENDTVLDTTGEAFQFTKRLLNVDIMPGVFISQETFSLVRGLFDVQPLDSIKVPWRKDSDQSYKVTGARPRILRLETKGFEGIETQMIGRENPLRILQDELYTCSEDRTARMVTVVGEAGIGKSRLLYEFQSWFDVLPSEVLVVRVFRGRATPDSRNVPYSLIRSLFDFRFEIRGTDSADTARQKLHIGMQNLADTFDEEMFHVIGHLIGLDFGDSPFVTRFGGDVKQFKQRAFQCFTDFMRSVQALDRENPVGMFLEDIHWADDESIALVQHTIQFCSDIPFIIVGTARPVLFEHHSNWGEGEDLHILVELKPLSKRSSRRMVQELLQRVTDLPIELRDTIVEHSDGNPYYVEEFTRMLIDVGVIVRKDDKWETNIEKLTAFRVPSTLIGVIQARLHSLDLYQRLVLQRASVFGRRFWNTAVTDLVPEIEDFQMDNILKALRETGLVYRRSDSTINGADEYVFRHSVLRDVTHETLQLSDRRRLHAAAAEWLIDIAGSRVREFAGIIADHYEQAKELEKASTWYEMSGMEAADTAAFDVAISHLNKALKLLSPVEVNIPKRLELLDALGNVYFRYGSYQAAFSTYENLLTTAVDTQDFVQQAHSWNALSQIQEALSKFEESLSSALNAERAAQQAGDLGREELIQALILKGTSLLRLGRGYEIMPVAQKALELALSLSSVDLMAHSHNLVGITHMATNDLKSAIEDFKSAATLFRQVNNEIWAVMMLNNTGDILKWLGEYELSSQFFLEALSAIQPLKHEFYETVISVNYWGVRVELGDYGDAIDHLLEILSHMNEEHFMLDETYLHLAHAYLAMDEVREASDYAIRGLSVKGLAKGRLWRILGKVISCRPMTLEIDGATIDNPMMCFEKSHQILTRSSGDEAPRVEVARTLREWSIYEKSIDNVDKAQKLWDEARALFAEAEASLELAKMDKLTS